MWAAIAKFILSKRILLLLVLGAITAFMAFQSTKVEMDYEYASLLPETDSVASQYKKFKDLFGEDSNVLVIGVQDKNFFQKDKFNHWIKLQDTIEQVEGVLNVISVSKAYDLKKDTENKRFQLEQLFPDELVSQAQLDTLAERLHDLPFYKNLLYNDTAQVYLLAITLAKEKVNSRERVALVDAIERATEHYATKYQSELHYSGLPYIRTRVAVKIKNELNLFNLLDIKCFL